MPSPASIEELMRFSSVCGLFADVNVVKLMEAFRAANGGPLTRNDLQVALGITYSNLSHRLTSLANGGFIAVGKVPGQKTGLYSFTELGVKTGEFMGVVFAGG